MTSAPEELDTIWSSTALQLAPEEDSLKARLPYRPAFSFADLANYASHVWGVFVAIGGLTAVQHLAEGAADKLGEELAGAAWKRLKTAFAKSPLESADDERDSVATQSVLLEADDTSRQLIANRPELLEPFLNAGMQAADDLMRKDGMAVEAASRIAQNLAAKVRERLTRAD